MMTMKAAIYFLRRILRPFWVFGNALLILKLESSRQPTIKIW